MPEQPMLSKLALFTAKERSRFETRDDNLFSISFTDISRYYDFLEIIKGRYQQLGGQYLESIRWVSKTFSELEGKSMNDEQVSKYEEHIRFNTELQFEIEAFFLFAKIMLDKIARSIEFYFGPVNKLSLDSHDDLTKDLIKYVDQKALMFPKDFINVAQKLKGEVSNFRDYQIVHNKSPRQLKAAGIDEFGRGRLLLFKLYPTEFDKQENSVLIEEAFADLNKYLELVMELITSNKDKSNLTSNSSTK